MTSWSLELSNSAWASLDCACGSRSRATLDHKRSKPCQVSQPAAQRLLASEVNTAARPRPYCQRTKSRSRSATLNTVSAVGDRERGVEGKRGDLGGRRII